MVLFAISMVATHIAVGGVVGIVVVVVLLASGRVGGPGELMALLEQDRPVLILQMISAPPLFLASLGVCLLFRRGLDRRSITSMGLGRPRRGGFFAIGVGFLVGAAPLAACVLALLALGGLEVQGVGASVVTALLVPVLLMMAFTEEIVARGYILRNFVDDGRPLLGLGVSSLIFWLMHLSNDQLWSSPWPSINLLGAGLVLGLAYLAADNLWFPTALHLGWNLAQGVLFECPISGIVTDGIITVHDTGRLPAWLVGGGFGLEGSALVTVAEILMAACLLLWWRCQQPTPG